MSVVVLGRDNYTRWRIEIEDALRGHGLWWHASGAEPKKNEPSPVVAGADQTARTAHAAKVKDFRDWDERDSKARSIIRRTLDDVTFAHVQDCKSSKAILDRVKELRDPKTTDVLMMGITTFFAETWREEDDVSSFLARLSVLAGVVNGIEDDDAKISDKFVMGKTLTSLPSQFGNFVQSWNLIAKKETKLDEFREKLLAAERGLTNECGSGSQVGNALRARRQQSKKDSDLFRGKCFGCGKRGHMKVDCPHGSDDDDDGRESVKSGSQCRADGKRRSRADGTSGAACVADYYENVALSTFSSVTDAIIADSGASRHLTGNWSWFRSVRKLVKPLEFRTAHGKIVATHAGSIDVQTSVDGRTWTARTWADVLYVPGLLHSLYSTTYREKEGFGFGHGSGSMMITRRGKSFIGGRRIGSSYLPFIRVVVEQVAHMVVVDGSKELIDRESAKAITRTSGRCNSNIREHGIALNVVSENKKMPTESNRRTTERSKLASEGRSTAPGKERTIAFERRSSRWSGKSSHTIGWSLNRSRDDTGRKETGVKTRARPFAFSHAADRFVRTSGEILGFMFD